MRQRIRRVAKLVDVKCARNFLGESCGHVLIIFRVAASHIRPGDPHFGTESSYVRNFFLRHLVRDHQQDAITFCAGNERQPQTGIPCGSLHDRAARLQISLSLGRFDHRQRDSVLDRATRILIFKFQKKLTRASVELRNLHQRRVANERQNCGRFVVRSR